MFKRNLSVADARKMLADNGLEIVHECGGFNGEQIKEDGHHWEVVYWAKKI